MVKITVDDTLLAKLHNLDLPLELCDESGRVLGHFTPAVDQAAYEGVESPTSEEELRRRSQQGGGRSLAEIIEHLQKHG
jgi:hypothetical protein